MKLQQLLIYTSLLFITQSIHAQSSNVKGTVTDENGHGIPATITSRQTNRSITADNKGHFLFTQLPSFDTLQITGLTIDTLLIPLQGRSDIGTIFTTKRIRQEAEVTVFSNGYQALRPNEMNGSVVTLNQEAINRQVGTNILQRLDGITPGFLVNLNRSNRNPQNTTNITIRGLATIKGALDPLIVLNGFIYEGTIDNINPNDVVSITVLKDAAAASIWGARAGNGVIVIQTKTAAFQQPVQVAFSSTTTFTEKPDLYAPSQISSSSYIDLEEFLFNQGYFDNFLFEPFVPVSPAVEIFDARRNGLISAADSQQGIDRLKQFDLRDDFLKYAYVQGITQQYAINVRGGSEKNAWLVSSAYDRSLGSLRDKQHKWNFAFQNSYRPVDALTLSVNLYYTNDYQKAGIPGFGNGMDKIGGRTVPYLRLVNDNGSPASIATTYRENFTDTAGGGRLLDWKYYPLREYLDAPTYFRREEIYATFNAQYKIARWLSLDTRYQYQRELATMDHIASLESYEARNMVNSYSQLNRQTGVVTYIIPKGGIRSLNTNRRLSQTARAQLNFQHGFGRHTITAIAGAEIRQAKSEGEQFTAYGYNAESLQSTGVDYTNAYPDFITGSSNSIGGRPVFTNTVYRFVSVYANAAYIFNSRYSVAGSIRRDGSNIFGASTNDRWKPLGSVSAGWTISNEPFYKLTWLPQLRMRASYGVSGNVDLSKTPLPIARYLNPQPPAYLPAARIDVLNNPRLQWEESHQYNLGLDFSSKAQRLSGSIEYYIKTGDKLYGEAPYDYTSFGAATEIIYNIASIRGHGWDVQLESRNIQGKFRWTTNYLLSYNLSKTKKYLRPGSNSVIPLLGAGTAITPVVDYPMYALVAYRWAGLDATGAPQGYLNGAPSTNYREISTQANAKGFESGALVYIGPANPTYFGALANSISYKGFTLSANVTFKFHYYFMKRPLRYNALIGTGISHADYEKRWKQPGDEAFTDVPSFVYPYPGRRETFYANAEVHAVKGDHIRLQYINLSYQFPASGKWWKQLEAYANAANLGILWRANKHKLDPDYPDAIPPSRTWAIGLRANF